MKWWECLFSPAAAARKFNALEDECAALRNDVTYLEEAFDAERSRADLYASQIEAAEERSQKNSKAYLALSEDMLKMQANLRDADKKLAEMAALRNKLADATAEIKEYDRRIARLKSALDDSRAQLKRAIRLSSENDILKPVSHPEPPDMLAPPPRPVPPLKRPDTHRRDRIWRQDDIGANTPEADDDWLNPLPPDQR